MHIVFSALSSALSLCRRPERIGTCGPRPQRTVSSAMSPEAQEHPSGFLLREMNGKAFRFSCAPMLLLKVSWFDWDNDPPDDPSHRPPIKWNLPATTDNTSETESFHAALPKGHERSGLRMRMNTNLNFLTPDPSVAKPPSG
jgi:hypothetical protein